MMVAYGIVWGASSRRARIGYQTDRRAGTNGLDSGMVRDGND